MPYDFGDFTVIGLGLGAAAAFCYFVAGFVKNKKPEILDGAVVCLAVYATFAGVELIHAALQGDTAKLPPLWRAYVVVASVVVIGLSIDNILKKIRGLFQKPPQPDSDKNKTPPPDA